MRRIWIGIIALGVAVTASGQEPVRLVGEGGRIFEAIDAEQLLARPYEDFVPMACVGECLWAAHPGGWAFEDAVHYYLLGPCETGFNLELDAVSAPLVPYSGTAYPSHVRMQGGTDAVRVEGEKWITADDVLVSRLRVTNQTGSEVKVLARLTLPTKDLEREGDRIAWTASQAGLDVLLRGVAPGFTALPEKAPAPQAFYIQAEAPSSQRGSTGSDRKAGASGGAVLGSNFGGTANDTAQWEIAVEQPIDDAVLSIRYARATAGEAEYKITVDGYKPWRQGFGATGGWGATEGDFKVAQFPLGKLAAGKLRVTALALADGCNVNFDLLSVHPSTVAFAAPGVGKTALIREFTLGPKGSEVLQVALAAATRVEKAEGALARVCALPDALADQQAAYDAWLTGNVPAFKSSDDALTRMYWHRATSIVRKNLFKVGEGRLNRWAVAEGRWNSGWYPNIISYGAGHQIRETRWLRDPLYVRDIISTWCENARDNRIFPSHIRPDSPVGGQYTDWITSTVYDAYCVAPDLDRLQEWLPALERNIDGWMATYDQDADGLLLVDSHWWTGMEWQPSFFYFNGFDKDQQKQALERVDLSAYVYGGARHLAALLRLAGEEAAAQRYDAIAEKIHTAVASVMWDDATKFFYSVEPEKHEKALVKEVIGVYPFYFGMFQPGAEDRFADAWWSLINPEEFWTEWPVASASKQCPAYSQDITFHGKEVGGCMWNGPTWPHANSLVLSAMAETLRSFPSAPLTPSHFYVLLNSFTLAQFYNQDLRFPWTGEYYSGDTAQWRTAERDYNHSTYLDVIIADLAGLRPRIDDTLEVHPMLYEQTPSFSVDGIRYHGHDVTLAWTTEQDAGKSPDGLSGYRVYVDGKRVFHAPGLPALPAGKPLARVNLSTGALIQE